jgi:IclR family transcriptional regulator, KDG regulon repressor
VDNNIKIMEIKLDAINKALEILDLFLHSDDELSINDVSERTHITYPTAHRITSTLVKRGYLIQPEKRGKYSVHPGKLSEFIGIIRKKLNVRTIASPYIHDLSQTINEAVLLAVRRGNAAINVDVVNRGRLLNLTPDTATLGLYSTGAGKVFLAYLSEKELQIYFENVVMAPKTPNSITDKDILVKQINEIRRSGVSFDDEENETGLRSVAAPIRDWEGKVIAAISIIGPTARISKTRLAELAVIIKDYALRISQAMGVRS